LNWILKNRSGKYVAKTVICNNVVRGNQFMSSKQVLLQTVSAVGKKKENGEKDYELGDHVHAKKNQNSDQSMGPIQREPEVSGNPNLNRDKCVVKKSLSKKKKKKGKKARGGRKVKTPVLSAILSKWADKW